MTLKASAAKGAFSSAGRSVSRPSPSSPFLGGSMPTMGGTSSGDGSSSTIASRSGCTPLFLKEEPQSTGVILMSMVARCSEETIRSWGISSSLR